MSDSNRIVFDFVRVEGNAGGYPDFYLRHRATCELVKMSYLDFCRCVKNGEVDVEFFGKNFSVGGVNYPMSPVVDKGLFTFDEAIKKFGIEDKENALAFLEAGIVESSRSKIGGHYVSADSARSLADYADIFYSIGYLKSKYNLSDRSVNIIKLVCGAKPGAAYVNKSEFNKNIKIVDGKYLVIEIGTVTSETPSMLKRIDSIIEGAKHEQN